MIRSVFDNRSGTRPRHRPGGLYAARNDKPARASGIVGAPLVRRPALARLVAVVLALMTWGPPGVCAASTLVEEYVVKAAFIFNFAKFISWPEEQAREGNGTLSICVLGADPFGLALDSLNGKSLRGKTIRVERVPSLAAAKGCHVLYISPSERRGLGSILEQMKGTHVLTVGDMEGFAEAGGMINLIVEDGRVQFEVNLQATQRAGLEVSSHLLRLARIVENTSR